MKRYICCTLLIIASLHFLDASPLRERVYLQTDKQLYLAGESVLLKVVSLDQEQIPLTLSKIAYVELVGDSIARLQIMIELTDGTGSGQMQLPANLPTGYYRLIAYTQYMRNEGDDVFFEKNIAVVNTFLSGYHLVETEAITEQHFLLTSLPDLSTGEGAGMVSLQTDKAAYTTRERGQLILNGLPENIHTLSVSVAGKDMIPVTESAHSLFQKNKLKQPEMYTGEFLPEYEGHIVTGTIVDNETEKPVTDNVSIVSGISFPGEDGIRFFLGQKIKTSDVRFFTSNISGAKEIASVVYLQGEKYHIAIQSPFISRFAPKQMPQLHIDSAYYDQLIDRSVALQVFRYFMEDPSANRNVSEPFLMTKPTWSYPLDDYTRFTTMGEIFIEFIDGARFRRNAAGMQEISVLVYEGNDVYRYGTMPLVLLDGVPVNDHETIYNYDPLTVERINIYWGPIIFGGNNFDGIVELTTYRRLYQDLNVNKSTQIISYEAPQLPLSLNIPVYPEGKNSVAMMPDSRHTLLWNPDIQTNGQISFSTSDLTGVFQATVEGITKDGQFIFATVVFMVE